MSKVVKLNINDPTGAFKNINDLLEELRNDNIEALAVVYTRRDHSVRTFMSGLDRILLVGTLEQLKFDVLENNDSVAISYDEKI